LRTVRVLGGVSALLLCGSLITASGGSRQFTPAERAAITAAQRSDNLLRIFPAQPGTISCRILVSGPVRGFETGRCTTMVSESSRRTRLDFIEQARPGTGERGVNTVILDKRNRVVGGHWHGAVPQLQL
jgi:hypothetical protein